MPVSSELLLSITPAAPSGSSRNSASIKENRSQGAGHNPAQDSTDRFKDYLAQETDKPNTGKPQETHKQTAGKAEGAVMPEAAAEPENMHPENIREQNAAAGKTPPTDVQSNNENFDGNNAPDSRPMDPEPGDIMTSQTGENSEPNRPAADPNQIALNTAEQLNKEVPDRNITSSDQVAPHVRNPQDQNLAEQQPQESAPKEDNAFGPAHVADNIQAGAGKQNASSDGKAPEPARQDQAVANTSGAKDIGPTVAPTLAASQNQQGHVEASQKVSAARDASSDPRPLTPDQENLAFKNAEGAPNPQATAEDEAPHDILMATASAGAPEGNPEENEGKASNSIAPESQKPAAEEKAAPQAGVTTRDVAASPLDAATSGAPEAEQPAAPSVQQPAAAPVSPEQQLATAQQPLSAAAAQPTPVEKPEGLKDDRDLKKVSAKNSAKETDEKEGDVTAGGKKQSASSGQAGNAKGSSQNSTEAQYSARSTEGGATQSKPPAENAQNIASSRIPFLTELSQTMTGGEAKTVQMSSPQLQTGLLSIQEVGPNSHQTGSLTSASQPRPAMPRINPQMVTHQISMAIAKQTAADQQSFRISLNPRELGHLDIKMDFQADGRMTTTIVVENERTLSLLQKDQAALEKALENTGFDAGGNNLNFTLKKQQQNHDPSQFASNSRDDGEIDEMPRLPDGIIGRQQLKMTYSDNALDINI